MDHFHRLLQKIPSGQELMKGLMSYDNSVAHKRAHELMHKPVITCSPLARADKLAEMMCLEHISSIVSVDEEGQVAGYISEQDLVEKIVARNYSPQNLTAREIANPRPVCVDPASSYYQVLLEMIKEQVKHVIVTDQNRPIGIITIGDLIRSRKTEIISVINQLRKHANLNDLAALGRKIEQVLGGLILEKASIPEILDIITELYDQLTGRVIALTVEEMLPDYGPPPVKFCWLTMGSNGRREQFWQTDQDNALIYQNVSDPCRIRDARNISLF
jgi:CBS domain-containing protein